MSSAAAPVKLAGAIAVPFLVHAILVVIAKSLEMLFPIPIYAVVTMPVLSAAAGFAFIKGELTRTEAVVVAVVYFPMMWVVLALSTFWMVGGLYGEFI